MQTRKRWLSIILVLVTFIFVLFCAGMNVCAEAVTDGISVSVSSDKAEYDSDDEVKLEITVKNTNDFEVSNLRIENILPDGIKLVSGNVVEENVTLKADGEKTVKLSVAKDEGNSSTTSSTSSTPKTGENGILTILLVVLLIAGVVIVFVLKGKKGCKFFSIVLCLCLIGQFAPMTLVNAQNSTSEDSLSSLMAECTYKIDGTEYLHRVVILYDNIDLYIFKRVDTKLYETIVTDEFKNASLAERKEIASNLLNELKEENLIVSIKFNEEYNAYFFKYQNGAEGSILLDNDSNSEELPPTASKSLSSVYISSCNDNASSIPSGLVYTSNKNAEGHVKQVLTNNNLTYQSDNVKALIIDDFSVEFNEFRVAYSNHEKIWSSNDLNTTLKSNVTVEDFKTILNSYDLIDINAHGYIDFTGNPTIQLQEECTPLDLTIYFTDRISGRVGTRFGVFGGDFYLTPSFFSYYYANKLSDTIIWVSCCNGYSNDNLVSVLANECNAKAVVGTTNVVYIEYDVSMTDIFVYNLLLGNTVEEALSKAKSEFGRDDEVWLMNRYNQTGNTPAEYKAYNGGNETLVELEQLNNNGTLSGTVTDENDNPVKGAEIVIDNIRGQSFETTAITDDNGKYTLECLADSYKITAKATGYSTFESDKFIDVVYGKETIYNITLKKDSGEVSEVEPFSYTWHVEPTIEADFVGVLNQGHPTLDYHSEEYYQFNTNWYSEYCGFSQDGLFGIIDYDGNIIASAIYDEISVKSGRKCILTDESFKHVKLLSDGSISDASEEYYEVTNGYPSACWIEDEKQLGITGTSENVKLESPITAVEIGRFDEVVYTTRDNALNPKYVLIKENKKLSDTVYENAGCFFDGIIPVKKDGKWGYVNENGDTVIPFEYDDAWASERTTYHTNDDRNVRNRAFDASDGYVVLCQNGQYALYTTTGECAIPFGELEEISPVYEGMAWAKKDGKWGVIQLGEVESQAEAKEDETTLTNQKSNWRQLYAEQLKNFISSDDRYISERDVMSGESMFDLYDIDGDNVPELFISPGTYHLSRVDVYSINDRNEVIKIGDVGQYGGISFIENKKYLYAACEQGHSYKDFYVKENNQIKLIFDAYTGCYLGGTSSGHLGADDAEYFINGSKSTKEVYDTEIVKYYDMINDTVIYLGRKYMLNETTIESVLLNN